MVTVVCVYKTGGDFTYFDVYQLKSQIAKYLTVSHQFVVLTDEKNVSDSIPLETKLPGYWSKMELFRRKFYGTVLYFDLDTVLRDNIDYLAIYAHKFTMLRPFNPERKFGAWASGIMAWNGDYRYIYQKFIDEFKGQAPHDMAGDQKYIAKYLGFEPEAVQDIQSGVYSYKRHCLEGVPKNASIICFHGKPRPNEVQLR